MIEPKPCPFCGTHLVEAEFLSTRVAKCYVHPPAAGGEICHAEHTVVWSNRADVWNRRATDGPEPIRYWERTEQDGERSSRILVDLVGRSIADIDVLYINDDAYVPADRHRAVVDEYAEFVKQHEKEVGAISASIPAEIGELVERLGAFAAGCRGSMWQSRDETIRLCDEAASLIQSQAARIAELEAAMEPFADRYDAWGDAAKGPYTNEDYTPRMVADFARARALLNRRAEG